MRPDPVPEIRFLSGDYRTRSARELGDTEVGFLTGARANRTNSEILSPSCAFPP